jgi:hypothetical protein
MAPKTAKMGHRGPQKAHLTAKRSPYSVVPSYVGPTGIRALSGLLSGYSVLLEGEEVAGPGLGMHEALAYVRAQSPSDQ